MVGTNSKSPRPFFTSASAFLRDRGFSLVEILILVVIIGLLANLAIPSLNEVREAAQNGRLINDWRTFSGAFHEFALENGAFPDEVNRGTIPAGMEEYLSETQFTDTTFVGGNWDWDMANFGVSAGLSIVDTNLDNPQFEKIDARIDDGDLSTGLFRRVGSTRYMYVLEL